MHAGFYAAEGRPWRRDRFSAGRDPDEIRCTACKSRTEAMERSPAGITAGFRRPRMSRGDHLGTNRSPLTLAPHLANVHVRGRAPTVGGASGRIRFAKHPGLTGGGIEIEMAADNIPMT